MDYQDDNAPDFSNFQSEKAQIIESQETTPMTTIDPKSGWLIKLITKLSGGFIQNTKQAKIVLFGVFLIFGVATIVYLYISLKTDPPKETPFPIPLLNNSQIK